MSVSLVKVPAISPATIVYVAGHNTAGYSPDGEPAAFATIDAARSYLADELDRLADFLYDTELADDDTELADSVAASVEMVKADTDGDIAWSVAHHGGWSTFEDDGRSLPTVYWIHAAPIGDVFGDDTESDEYLTLIDEIASR
jgi:hypothetical protein